MGKQVGIALVLAALVFFLPWLWGGEGAASPPEPAAEEDGGPAAPEDAPPQPAPGIDRNVTLSVLIGGELKQMDMASYLMGVVRAEMPASFEAEALKAQAVAARTYTLYKMENGGAPGHPQADACDDITCCKAYLSAEDAALSWGADSGAWEEKIRKAVEDTDGECVLYRGEPVLAVFHSSSAGRTQDAAAVWSQSLPYLQSVESPENEDTVPNYRSQASFPAGELKELLLNALPEADLSGSPSDWFTNMKVQENGAVTSLAVGGVSVSGSRLRTILGLRSACFTLSFPGDQVVFSVTGYGHGVGMSQYGANVLAGDGMDYREILAWYYTDTTVDQYRPRRLEQSGSEPLPG